MFPRPLRRDLRTKIIIFSRNVSSHKTDQILSEILVIFTHDWLNSNWISRVVFTYDWLNSHRTVIACSVLPFILHDNQKLMIALEWECFCLIEISINVNKMLSLLLLHVVIRFFYTALCCWLFTSKFPFIFNFNRPRNIFFHISF